MIAASSSLLANRPAPFCRRGFTLVEAVIAMSITGFVFAAVTTQLVRSAQLTGRITETLEHSRNSRELLDTLSADVRAAQVLSIHPSFSDRSAIARDGESGNYLVLQTLDTSGVITRTVGYYVVPAPGTGTWILHRHDSARGDSAAGALPAANTAGRHRVIKRTVRLPASNQFFRSARDRGVYLEGQVGAAEAAGTNHLEFIACTLSTRS